MHGKTSLIYHDGKTIYEGLASPFEAGRYHSLSIEQGTLPHYLKVTAVTEDGEVMGVRHERFVVEGVQFHPESILTEVGHHILKRFLSISSPFWGETG
jgi:anthranilate synthase component 2/para-aminobenzoate synthetase component 2